MNWSVERSHLSFDGLSCSIDGMSGVYTGMIGRWDDMRQYILLFRCAGKSYEEVKGKIEYELLKIEVPNQAPILFALTEVAI